jgi:hypothetical protein
MQSVSACSLSLFAAARHLLRLFKILLSSRCANLRIYADECCKTSVVVRFFSCRCPEGKRLVEGDGWCENIDECAEKTFVCYFGTCRDLEYGYTCDCEPGYAGPTCIERRDATSVVVSTSALFAIVVCAVIVLSEYTRRMRTSCVRCCCPASYLQRAGDCGKNACMQERQE